MPRLSLGLGVQNIRKVKAGVVAPILVASTASVVISGNATFNGTAVKKVNPQLCLGAIPHSGQLFVYSGVVYAYDLGAGVGKILIQPQALITDDLVFGTPDKLNTPSNTWKLVNAYYNGENDFYDIIDITNNPSTDANYIPTTGWSPSITITAA
jgi:hypothetical protein